MSLINDALKRAQSKPPPPPGSDAAMRPADVRTPALWPVIVLPIALFLIFGVGGWFLWRGLEASRRQRASNETSASEPAKALATVIAARENKAARPPDAQTTKPADAAAAVAEPAPPPKPVDPPKPVTLVAPPPAVAATNPPPPAVPGSVTSLAVPAKVLQPTLKLQGIFYRPSNPSVVINSKTLFLGEVIENTRVVAIDRSSVTLESGGQTYVLTLP
jgi:hypothetical protein